MKLASTCISLLSCCVALPLTARAQPRWTVGTTPVVDIKGTTEKGDVVFNTANWATRLTDGVIIVADNGAPGLRVFDQKGQAVKTIGRSGQGPGEFQSAFWVGQCSEDSLFVWDFPRRKMTVFDANGTFVRSFMPPSESDAFTVACNRKGLFALFGYGRMGPGAKVTTLQPPGADYAVRIVESKLVLSDASGNSKGTVDEVPSGEILALSRGGGGPRPLGRKTSVAVSADNVFLGTGEPTIDVYGIDGKKKGVIALKVTPRASTKEHYERATAVVASMFPAQMRDQATRSMLEIPPPEKLPPYSSLHADPDGLLWVVLSVPGDKDTQLRALKPDGQAVANVIVPVNLSVFEIGADYILGAREDADGEQHVVMYRLNRGR